MSATAEMLGPGGILENRKPVFIATSPSRYTAAEKESLTDQEKIALKTFQLHRRVLAMERRDEVYNAIISAPSTAGKCAELSLGSPFPVVKVDPTFQDVILGHRWHEYLLELLIPTVYIKYAAAKPIQRQAIHYGAFWYPIWTMVWGACFFVGSFRTFHRLVGLTPNVPECEYYGVVESPQRLEEKRRLWEKYTKYRNEWMRRFDYHVYGIRPGEALSFFSPCFLPPASTPYNTRTDFKMRETNLFTNTIKHGPLPHERIPMDPNNLVTKDRPEYGFFRNYNTMWDGMEERKWANYAANTKNSN